MIADTRKTLLFLALAYGLSWAIAGAFVAAGGRWGSPASLAVAVAYMAMPAVAAVIVQLLHRDPWKPLGLSFRVNRWWFVAWLIPVPLAFAALGLGMLAPGVSFAPDMSGLLERFPDAGGPEREEILRQLEALPVHPLLLAVVQGLAAGITVNAVAAFGEELGWRGLLHRQLRPMGFWRSSIAIGILWGLWHAPIILLGHNYPQHPQAGVPMMVAFAMLLSPLFTWIRDASGSVISAAILHGSINALAGVALVFLKGGSDLMVGMTGLVGLTVLATANLLLFTGMRRAGQLSSSNCMPGLSGTP